MHINSSSWLEAQNSVLGAALIEPKVVPRVLAALREEDFSGPCQTVYAAMREVFNSGFPVDAVSVANKLGAEYRQFLIDLMKITPTAANVDYYINLCREQSRVLACRGIGKELADSESVDSVRQLVEKASGLLVSAQAAKAMSMTDCLQRFFGRADEKDNSLTWPIQGFQGNVHARPGKFIIIGAKPSVGKTAFALQCAWHWAASQKVGFFSFETDPDELFDRLTSGIAGVPFEALMNREITEAQWDSVCAAAKKITSRKLDLIPAAGMTVSDIRAKIMEAGYKVVIVDYLQIITAKGGNRFEQVTNISIDLHILAQSTGVTVVALSQVTEYDSDRAPRSSDLRESRQLEQDADIIIMMNLVKESQPAGPRNLYVTKNKTGTLFKMILTFDGRYQRFAKGGMLDSVVAENKELKQKFKGPRPTPGPIPGQFEMLPTETDVPFKD